MVDGDAFCTTGDEARGAAALTVGAGIDEVVGMFTGEETGDDDVLPIGEDPEGKEEGIERAPPEGSERVAPDGKATIDGPADPTEGSDNMLPAGTLKREPEIAVGAVAEEGIDGAALPTGIEADEMAPIRLEKGELG